ncbi:MAG: cell division protein FtsZ [Mycoplasma sp.]
MENKEKKLHLGLMDEISEELNFDNLVSENIQTTNIPEVRNLDLSLNNEYYFSKEEEIEELFDNLGDFNFESQLNIKVLGVGGAGNNMLKYIANGTSINKKNLFAINTDYQVLKSLASGLNICLIGKEVTRGLGSGSNPDIGREAAIESLDTIKKILTGTNLLFIVSGMGKGTGTGASPIIAELAKEMGILVISLVNLPSITNEGKNIYEKGSNGLDELSKHASGILTISNEKLFNDTNGNIPIWESFLYANQVISNVINEMINLVTIPSEINVDFNDMKNFFNKQTEFQVNSFTFSNEEDIIKKINEKLSNEIFQDSLSGASKVIINYKLNPKVTNQFINDIRIALEEITENKDLEVTYAVAYDSNIEYATMSIIAATNRTKPSDNKFSFKKAHEEGEKQSYSHDENNTFIKHVNPFHDKEEFRNFEDNIEQLEEKNKVIFEEVTDEVKMTPTKLNKIINRTIQFNGPFNKK